MPIKCIRLEIVKPADETTWAELGEVLRDLRYSSSKIANFVIQKCYEWENFSRDYKEKNGRYPSPKEHKDKSYIYPLVREKFPDVASNNANQIRQKADKVWKTNRLDVLNLRKSIPSFKLNFPICIYNKNYSINKTDNSYIINMGLHSRNSNKKIRYQIIIKAGENSKRAILNRLISGEYKQGALQIISDRKKKWYCIIPYEFTVEENHNLDPDKIMGIDLGISNAVYWAFNDSLKRGYIGGGEIETFRKKVQERRKSMQRQGKFCGEGRIGHGRKRHLQPIEKLQEKESNFRATTNHRYAKKIVQEAFKHGCGIIQMEDLTDINKDSNFLKNWPYYDLQTKIIDKANELGINVVKIKPEYTSQRCSECGNIDKENRLDQETFICKKCGFNTNADYNAAKNIATPNIENLIKENL